MAESPYYSIGDLLSGIVFNEIPTIVPSGALSLSVESDLNVSAQITAFASSSLDGSFDLSVSGFAITTVSASIAGLFDVNIVTPSIQTVIGEISLSTSFNTSIADIVRFTPSSRYPGSYATLLLLDGIPLTAQNRKFSDDMKTNFIEQKNWNNSKSRYYKRSGPEKRTFKLSWEWLPSYREETIDKREARNYIKDKALDPDVHTLTLLSYGQDPEDVFEETNYNVFITNYSENLTRRDLSAGTYFWQCDLDLEEL
jgi:hypothetical protein